MGVKSDQPIESRSRRISGIYTHLSEVLLGSLEPAPGALVGEALANVLDTSFSVLFPPFANPSS